MNIFHLIFLFFNVLDNLNMKWTETTFPFTHPSWELEIEYKGVWYEVLGCGIIEQKILNNGKFIDELIIIKNKFF